jgi:cytochrome c oxidase subunit III
MSATADAQAVRHLGTDAKGPEANIWWGIAGLITIEIVVFGTFISSYFYYKATTTDWPPEPPPDLLLPLLNTLVLVGSSAAIFIADRGIAKGSQQRLRWGLVASTVLAVVFLVLKYLEFDQKEYRWDSHSYGSIVWTMLSLHALHVFSVMLKSAVMTVLAFKGYFTRHSYIGVQVNGLYWHFVVLIWVPIFITVYLSPRWGS